jgi:uncharacterized protein
MKKTNLITLLFIAVWTLSSCSSFTSENSRFSADSATSINDPNLWNKSKNTTWLTLQHTPLSELETAQTANSDPNAKAWLQLAIISKQYSANANQLITELQNWRHNNPSHAGNELIPSDNILEQLATTPRPQHIALLLPLHGTNASSGQTVRNGFMNAYYEQKNQAGEQKLSFYDTNETTDIAGLYQKAVSDGADIIIGPLTKSEVESLQKISQFDVPLLALNYTPSSFLKSLPANLYQFGLSPTTETEQMADRAKQAGHVSALIISADNSWGHKVADALRSRWQSNGGKIVDSLFVKPEDNLTQDIAALLHINPKEDRNLVREGNTSSMLAEQRRHDFDVIFVFAQPDTARQIVPLLRFYYAGDIPVYSISAIYSGRPNPVRDKDLNGVTFCETPWLIQMAHTANGTPEQYNRLYAIGRDAYLISQSLSRLNALPNFPIYGATGALDIQQQQIYQRLPWVTIHDGQI